jgi:hypothetical protein
MSNDESRGGGGGSPSRTPFTSLIRLIIIIILGGVVLFAIKMYYRDPALRHYDLCFYPYLIYRTTVVDVPKHILVLDPSLVLANSNRVTNFFYSCLDTTKEWEFLKKI